MVAVVIITSIAIGLSVYSAWGVVQCKQKDKELFKLIELLHDCHKEEMDKIIQFIDLLTKMHTN